MIETLHEMSGIASTELRSPPAKALSSHRRRYHRSFARPLGRSETMQALRGLAAFDAAQDLLMPELMAALGGARAVMESVESEDAPPGVERPCPFLLGWVSRVAQMVHSRRRGVQSEFLSLARLFEGVCQDLLEEDRARLQLHVDPECMIVGERRELGLLLEMALRCALRWFEPLPVRTRLAAWNERSVLVLRAAGEAPGGHARPRAWMQEVLDLALIRQLAAWQQGWVSLEGPRGQSRVLRIALPMRRAEDELWCDGFGG